MVKNTKGGKGHKSMGRKHQSVGVQKLILSSDPLEKYAIVTKMYGNGMCEVYYITDDNKQQKVIGHIRNKMRGRQKRHNTVTPNSYVLAGLREWESVPKNCDILALYDDNQIKQLKQMPDINISELAKLSTAATNNVIVDNDDDFGFTIGNTSSIQDSEVIDAKDLNEIQQFVDNDGDEINIDDI